MNVARFRFAAALLPGLILSLRTLAAAEPTAPFEIQLDTVREGYDGKTCFAQARCGIVPRGPGKPPIVVMTMNPLIITGSDVYLTVNDMRTDDFGKTWTGPTVQENLGRRPGGTAPDGRPIEVGICDLWPKWHAHSGKLLNIGHTVKYVDAKGPMKGVRRETGYTVYDPESKTWSPWKLLLKPGSDEPLAYGAGCIQRVDLPSGEILLPVYGGQRSADDPYTHVRVLRLSFDGTTLALLEEGPAMRQDSKRGYAEPSLTKFRDKFYLTIRHDDTGYVCTSDDGLHFNEPRPWCWDDGTNLGNYNTQTHWVTHDDALFLTYTRRGANNDHVFRNRAPLFIGEVDPQTLRVRRDTEQILIPERGARYGNFGVTAVGPNETWVTETEWMQTWKQASNIIPVDNPYGAKNRVYVSRIIWNKPNTGWNSR